MAIRKACQNYLFLRVADAELYQVLDADLNGFEAMGYTTQDFLSEFRQRRAEYFSFHWTKYEASIEVNALDYRDWKRGGAAAAATTTDSSPSVSGELEFATLEQLESVRHTVVVVVTAPLCSWCRLLDPVFAQLSASAHALVGRIDASRHWDLVQKLQVRRFPEVFLYRNGKQHSRFPLSEPRDVDSLNAWLVENNIPSSHPLRWRMALNTDVISEMRISMASERRIRSVRESIRALGGCLDNGSCRRNRLDTDPPIIIILGGGIASGKSSLLVALQDSEFWKKRGADVVCVEADKFKLADPLFEAISKAGSPSEASKEVHRDSTNNAEKLLLSALNRGRDIVFDGTSKWAPFVTQTIQMVRQVHEYETTRGPGYFPHNGTEQYWIQESRRVKPKNIPYQIWFLASYVSPNVAVGRSVRRAILDGRSQALRELLRSHKLFASAFPAYVGLVDRVLLYDNTRSRPLHVVPPLICQKELGSDHLAIEKPDVYAKFLKMRDINLGATSMYNLYDRDNDDDDDDEDGGVDATKSVCGLGKELERHASPTRFDFGRNAE